MKALFLLLASATLALSVPLAEEQQAKILADVEDIRAAAKEQGIELDSAKAKNKELQDKSDDQKTLIGQQSTAIDAVSKATIAVQNVVNERTTERDEARKEVAKLTKAWWHLFFWNVGEGVVIILLVAFIFRKTIARLFGVPIP